MNRSQQESEDAKEIRVLFLGDGKP
jgi:hypothetical protein